jgi:CO/xanthine dehydrogenase Mo-binding subunit
MADASQVAGRRMRRADGKAKVHGVAVYPADLAARAKYHAATVRASVACGWLDAVELAGAHATPGVVRVLTAADVPGHNRFGLITADQPVLVERAITGASDVVALVIAESASAAKEGARRVRLTIRERAGVFDAEHALDRGAPSVHADRASLEQPNLLAERRLVRGDVARAMARAAVVVHGTYRTTHIDHAFLSPEAGLAWVDTGGRFVLEAASQWPQADLRQAAVVLGVPLDRLRLVQTTIGGAFGGREDISVQLLLLLAAQAVQDSVFMGWDRAESVRGHGKRHPFVITHTLGADRRGRIVAAKVECVLDAGCYASTSVQLLDNALVHATGPYAVRHVEASGRVALTNNPFTCAFRGFGVNQVTFAIEQQVNKLAAALGMDPAEIRRKNLLHTPGTLGPGTRVRSLGGTAETIVVARERGERKSLPRSDSDVVHGRGFAAAIKNIGYGFGVDDRATAMVHLTPRGATVHVGAAEVGQGIETVLTQIAARALGLPPSRITVEWRDSDVAPDSGSSSASRQTMAAGSAVLGACRKLLQALDGRPVPEAGITRRHTWRFPSTVGLGRGAGRHLAVFGGSSCVADVAVDLVTGVVRLLRVVEVVDAGRVLNTEQFRGQVEGGVVMGQGYALTEYCAVALGMPQSRGFEGNGVPTAVDAVSAIEVVAVESPELLGPFGARGIGEVVMIPVVPAITAAIHDACGAWIDEIPATPERVRAALAARSPADVASARAAREIRKRALGRQ